MTALLSKERGQTLFGGSPLRWHPHCAGGLTSFKPTRGLGVLTLKLFALPFLQHPASSSGLFGLAEARPGMSVINCRTQSHGQRNLERRLHFFFCHAAISNILYFPNKRSLRCLSLKLADLAMTSRKGTDTSHSGSH